MITGGDNPISAMAVQSYPFVVSIDVKFHVDF